MATVAKLFSDQSDVNMSFRLKKYENVFEKLEPSDDPRFFLMDVVAHVAIPMLLTFTDFDCAYFNFLFF